MTHLSPDDCVSILEGQASPERHAHLEVCPSCHQLVEDLRSVWCVAASAEVPEPSPLFWDHLSTRIRLAIDAEAAPRPGLWARLLELAWGRQPWMVLTGAAAALAVAVIVGSRAWSPEPAVPPPSAVPTVALDMATQEPDRQASDEQWDLMVEMVAEVELDQADLGLGVGSADRAVDGLSDEERGELVRWLQQEIETAKGGTL